MIVQQLISLERKLLSLSKFLNSKLHTTSYSQINEENPNNSSYKLDVKKSSIYSPMDFNKFYKNYKVNLKSNFTKNIVEQQTIGNHLINQLMISLSNLNDIKVFDTQLQRVSKLATLQQFNYDQKIVQHAQTHFDLLSSKTRYLILKLCLKRDPENPIINRIVDVELFRTKYQLSELINKNSRFFKSIFQNTLTSSIVQFTSFLTLKQKLQLVISFRNSSLETKYITYLNEFIAQEIIDVYASNSIFKWDHNSIKWLQYYDGNEQMVLFQLFMNEYIWHSEKYSLNNNKTHLAILRILEISKSQFQQVKLEPVYQLFEDIYKEQYLQLIKTMQRVDKLEQLTILIFSNSITQNDSFPNSLQIDIKWNQYSSQQIQSFLRLMINCKKNSKHPNNYQEILKSINFPVPSYIQEANFLEQLEMINLYLKIQSNKELVDEILSFIYGLESNQLFYSQLRDIFDFLNMMGTTRQQDSKLIEALSAIFIDQHESLEPLQFVSLIKRLSKLKVDKSVYQEVKGYYLKNITQFPVKFHSVLAKNFSEIVVEASINKLKSLDQ